MSKAKTVIVPANVILAALPCVSTEETRYYLNGVFIEAVSPTTVRVTATDGHRLLTARHKGALSDGPFSGIVRITKETARALKGGRKDPPRYLVLHVDQARGAGADVGRIEVRQGAADDLSDDILHSSRDAQIDGTFPDYARIIPTFKTVEPQAPAWFNARYIADWQKVAAALYPETRHTHLQLVTTDETGPALVRFTGFESQSETEALGVIMPIRGDSFAGEPPAWAFDREWRDA